MLGRVILYVRDVEETAAFYVRHFDFAANSRPDDRIVELIATTGARLLLHAAGKGRKQGQRQVKLVFDVSDVPAFCDRAAKEGLVFGPIHDGGGYQFANALDPAGNAISVSSRAFARP